jgi:hypothetical protein
MGMLHKMSMWVGYTYMFKVCTSWLEKRGEERNLDVVNNTGEDTDVQMCI